MSCERTVYWSSKARSFLLRILYTCQDNGASTIPYQTNKWLHNVHNCIDLKQRTKATCGTTIQGTAKNYLQKLTACRLAAILKIQNHLPAKEHLTMLGGFIKPILHQQNTSTFNVCFFQERVDDNHRNLLAVRRTFDVISIHDIGGSIC